LTYLIDTDVLVIDHRYQRDPKHSRNRQAIDQLHQDGHEVGITCHALLEAVGIVSFSTPVADIPGLPSFFVNRYRLKVFPDPVVFQSYAQIITDDVVTQMATQMSLGDAVQAVQIRMFAPYADALLTWNAKHFKGKIAIPVLTPEEWLQQQPPPTVSTP
jgi:hypothetical protein